MTWRWRGRDNTEHGISGTCPKCKLPSAYLSEVKVKGIARWWCDYCIAAHERALDQRRRI